MTGFMTFILLIHASFGLLLMVGGVPLMRRKVGPNPWYGFRVRRTLENPGVWYDANAYAGACLFWLGLGTVTACLVLYVVPGIDLVVYSLSCLMVVLIGLAVCVILSCRFLNRLTRE